MTAVITESKLKADCTPEIIKRMVELAEGFKLVHIKNWNEEQISFYDNLLSCRLERIGGWCVFPLLIHRAVEGWNKVNDGKISIHDNYVEYQKDRTQVLRSYMEMSYEFDEYSCESLTPCECACLHCLIEVLG